MKRGITVGVLGALLLLGLTLSGCHLRPVLFDVSVSPDAISPNADGSDDATNIIYSLSRNARVSIYFENAAGERFYFRQERDRSAGDYRVQWGGTVNQPYWLENEYGRQRVRSWVLPDGVYTWVVEATDRGWRDGAGGRPDHDERRRCAGARTAQVHRGFSRLLAPTRMAWWTAPACPTISTRMWTTCWSTSTIPDDPAIIYPLEEQERAAAPGSEGYHYYDYDGGVDQGADPPPDGTYVVVGEARDLAGHHVVVSDTVTIVDGGKPRADVVNGEIHWGGQVSSLEGTEIYVPLGATLCFTTYVENYGEVPIRTSGPPPGADYRSDQNYNSLAVKLGDDSFYEQPGVWRFGLRFDTSDIDFPYRWAVGQPGELRCEMIEGYEQCFLDPQQRGTVSGCVELVGPFPRPDIFAWGALIHQWVGINAENNYVDRVLIHIGEP